MQRIAIYGWMFSVIFALGSCKMMPDTSDPPPEDPLVLEGEHIFFNETFDGNGRTCGTCHRAEDNFSLSPGFIATLPAEDPLFVAENNPQLANNFENPVLMRELGLIVENQDGFDDLANNFNMRGIPHTLALNKSIASRQGPRTGWSGDGAPGNGSLRAFATGAVIQHFTKSLKRIAGVDFRLPTDQELNALAAFQRSLGRQHDLALPLNLKHKIAARGQEIFMDRTLGKCNACHFNAGANGDPGIFGDGVGNLNFNTGVEALPDQPADLSTEKNPPDDGFGHPGSGEFNTPVLVEAADTGPFFHNNSIETIEGAVAFYNGDAFSNSPAGQLIKGATGGGINLDATQVVAVAAFLRVINVLENLRASSVLLETAMKYKTTHARQRILLERTRFEIEDGMQVLHGGGLHPDAVANLETAMTALSRSLVHKRNRDYMQDAVTALASAKSRLEN